MCNKVNERPTILDRYTFFDACLPRFGAIKKKKTDLIIARYDSARALLDTARLFYHPFLYSSIHNSAHCSFFLSVTLSSNAIVYLRLFYCFVVFSSLSLSIIGLVL